MRGDPKADPSPASSWVSHRYTRSAHIRAHQPYCDQVPPDALEDANWLDDYGGLSAEDAETLARRQQRAVRVIRPRTLRTMEHDSQRLNIFLDDDGSLIGFTAE